MTLKHKIVCLDQTIHNFELLWKVSLQNSMKSLEFVFGGPRILILIPYSEIAVNNLLESSMRFVYNDMECLAFK